MASEVTRSSLRGPIFQNFPGGACPQTPLAWACFARHPIKPSCNLAPPLSEFLDPPLKPHSGHNFLHTQRWPYFVQFYLYLKMQCNVMFKTEGNISRLILHVHVACDQIRRKIFVFVLLCFSIHYYGKCSTFLGRSPDLHGQVQQYVSNPTQDTSFFTHIHAFLHAHASISYIMICTRTLVCFV